MQPIAVSEKKRVSPEGFQCQRSTGCLKSSRMHGAQLSLFVRPGTSTISARTYSFELQS